MIADADPRLVLARDGKAARSLDGILPARAYTETEACTAAAGSASIRAAPDPRAEQVDQLLFGERFDVLERADGWAFGQAGRDGYVGWVRGSSLRSGATRPTHRVRAIRSAALLEPNFRAPVLAVLSLNALVEIEETAQGFVRAAWAGWVPERRLSPIGVFESDPAAVAERHLGSPYVWGGRDGSGVDCSGLVQQALYACGRACPRDSDQQSVIGEAIDRTQLARADLVFWRGHVGMMLDGERLIHANVADMAVAIEPLDRAIAGRREAGGGEPTGFRRVA